MNTATKTYKVARNKGNARIWVSFSEQTINTYRNSSSC